MPFEMSIALMDHNWTSKKAFGPIAERQFFSIPLLLCYASSIKFKPAVRYFRWSKFVSCLHTEEDFTAKKSIRCESISVEKEYIVACVEYKQVNGSFLMTIRPYIRVANNLLCNVEISCTGKDGEVDRKKIASGETAKLIAINSHNEPQLSVLVKGLKFSAPIRFSDAQSSGKPMQFYLFDREKQLSLVVSLTVEGNAEEGYLATLYSRSALLDCTGLYASVATNCQQLDIVRRTYITRAIPKSTSTELSIEKDITADSTLAPTLVTDFTVESTVSKCEMLRRNIGDNVYTDSDWIWSFLPKQLRDTTFICTPVADSRLRTRSLIQFTTHRPCIVVLLIDTKASRPKWIQEDGFRPLVQRAVARRIIRGVLKEINYALVARLVPANETVELKGNWSRQVGSMYSVCLLPASSSDESAESSDQILTQLQYQDVFNNTEACDCWAEGDRGVTLFHSDDDNLVFGVKKGIAWAEPIVVPHKVKSTGAFNVVDWETTQCYHLSYSADMMPGVFKETHLLKLVHRFVIVNHLEEDLMVLQKGGRTQDAMIMTPYHSEPYHSSVHGANPTSLIFRSRSTGWSLGCVDIAEIGSSVLHLPRQKGQSESRMGIVINIDVKAAEPDENCSVVVVIWQSTLEGYMALSIRNETDVPIAIRQAGLNFESTSDDPELYDVCVPPSNWVPYGWTDPDCGQDILVSVGTSVVDEDSISIRRRRVASISFLQAGESLRLPDSSGRIGRQGEIVLSVLVSKRGGRVLRLFRQSATLSPSITNRGADGSIEDEEGEVEDYDDKVSVEVFSDDSDYNTLRQLRQQQSNISTDFFCQFSSVCISLVLDKPVRREFMHAIISNIETRLESYGTVSSAEFTIADLQVDNYSETAVYPVFMHGYKKFEWNRRRAEAQSQGSLNSSHFGSTRSGSSDSSEYGLAGQNAPLLQFSVIKEILPSTATPIFKYVGFRMMPLAVETDSSTVRLLYYDLFLDLKYLSVDQVLASKQPTQWIEKFNREVMAPVHQIRYIDAFKAQEKVLATKLYFKQLVIHPLKIIITFIQSPFPRKETEDSTVLSIITALAGFDHLKLKLKSFQVEDALESRASLMNHIFNNIIEDLQSQVGQIAGSLALFGSPVGFANKIGHGVKAFFYEPYQGLVHSPQEFILGIGKGTSSLFSEVVSGAMISTGEYSFILMLDFLIISMLIYCFVSTSLIFIHILLLFYQLPWWAQLRKASHI